MICPFTGKAFKSLKEFCEYTGISHNRVHYYKHVRKLSLKEAISLAINKDRLQRNNRTYTDNKGNTFRTLKDMSAYYNIPVETLRHRIYAGYPIERVLDKKPITREEKYVNKIS